MPAPCRLFRDVYKRQLQDINVNSIIASKENENEVLIATKGAGVYKLNLGTYELTLIDVYKRQL